MNEVDKIYDADSAAARDYLSALQNVITRLANNSSQCKTWCITITSVIIVLVARTTAPNHAWIAIIPIITFCFLDAYYLSLEREFINAYGAAAKKLRNNELQLDDLYIFPTPRTQDAKQKAGRIFDAFLSTSVAPFYVLLLLMLAFVRVAVLTVT